MLDRPYPSILILGTLLACATRGPGPQEPPPVPPEETSTQTAPITAEASAAQAIVAPLETALPVDLRREWPPSEWTHARAFTYNFVQYGPGYQLHVVDEDGWSEAIRQDLPLTPELAKAAVELTHLTLGDVQASKCAFPRHAVVFYDADEQPIASVNICFECTDILLWPSYYDDEVEAMAKYEQHSTVTLEDGDTIELPLLFAVHEGVLERWDQLFEVAGADPYPPNETPSPPPEGE